MISSPHLATALLFDVLRRWILYLNRCVAASTLESLDAPGCQVPFSLEPILADLYGGQYLGPIPLMASGDLVSRACGRGGGGGVSGVSGGGNSADEGGGGGTLAIKIKSSTTGGSESAGAVRRTPACLVFLGRGEHALHPGGDGPPEPAR